MDLLLLAAALLFAAAGSLLLREKAEGVQEPVPYRLALPREGDFSASWSAALFSALSPLAAYHGAEVAAEVRAEGGRVEYRLYSTEAFEPSLRGLLASHFPEARLERIGDAGTVLQAGAALP